MLCHNWVVKTPWMVHPGEEPTPNMATDITTYTPALITLPGGLPDIITDAGDKTAWR
jgi:hypothetical protein